MDCRKKKAALAKAKVKYEAEKETLAELIKLRNEMRKVIPVIPLIFVLREGIMGITY